MIEINYHLTTYKKFLEDLAKYLDARIIDDTLYIPENAGEGYLKHVELADGAHAILSYFRLKKDLYLKRKKNTAEYYTFCCELITDVKEFIMTIELETFRQEKAELSAMYLTSFLYDVDYYLKHGSLVNSIRILLSPAWMKKNLGFDRKRELLQQYLELKTAGVLFKKMDAESRQIMSDLFSTEAAGQTPLFFHSRLFWLLEKFSSWLTPEIISRPNALDISRQDVERIRKIEAQLTADFSVPPLTIARLAKSVAVSESKLKTLFKAVYGLPIYEYFQKHRMEKARVMLLSGEYSIKDVGHAIGYANLSNFTLAFKKQFRQLPSDLLK